MRHIVAFGSAVFPNCARIGAYALYVLLVPLLVLLPFVGTGNRPFSQSWTVRYTANLRLFGGGERPYW